MVGKRVVVFAVGFSTGEVSSDEVFYGELVRKGGRLLSATKEAGKVSVGF